MKMKKTYPWSRQMYFFLHNVWALFVIVILTACWIIYLSSRQDLLSMMVLFLTGFLVYFFTSNMIVVLSISLFLAGIAHFIQVNRSHQMTLGRPLHEGMEDASGNDILVDISKSPVPANSVEHEPVAAPLPSKLIEQVFEKTDGATTAADIEKLKLQNDILNKVTTMQPLIQSMTKVAGLFTPTQ